MVNNPLKKAIFVMRGTLHGGRLTSHDAYKLTKTPPEKRAGNTQEEIHLNQPLISGQHVSCREGIIGEIPLYCRWKKFQTTIVWMYKTRRKEWDKLPSSTGDRRICEP